MPLFEYVCTECGKKFEQLVFSGDEGTVKCPSCGSAKAEKQFSTFAAGSASSGHVCGSGCSHGAPGGGVPPCGMGGAGGCGGGCGMM